MGSARARHRGSTRVLAAAAALTVGFGGAVVLDTVLWGPRLATADELGPGDGLTRLVVRVPGGVSAEQLATLDALPLVDSAQPLFDGTALVAGAGITAEDVRAVVAGAEVTVSVPGEVYAQPVSDPFWSRYGWNLENTGANVHGGGGVAGADVSAPTGWQAGTGRGLVVAVVDSGYTLDHPDMAGALWTNPDEVCGSPVDNDGNGKPGDCHGWNFYRDDADVSNGGDNAHGTAVAGLVAGRAGNGEGLAGVAPDVTVMPLVVGGGRSVDLWAGAQAIRYAADNGADVVNASWGTVQDDRAAAGILQAAIDYADTKGVVVVVAAGNDSLDRDVQLRYPASLDAPNLVTVGSSTAADGVAGHSAYGARSVELFAPGERLVVHGSDGGYQLGAGTSYAAPHVAAAVALYRAHDRVATPAQVKAALLADVRYVPAFSGRSVTGGRLSLDDLGNTAAPVSYSFSGTAGDAGTLAPRVVATGSAPAGDYSVVLGLGMEHGGQVYALADHEVTLDGVTASTGDDGAATFALGTRSALGSVVLTPTTELAAGRYVLTAQVLRDGSPLGLAYAAPLLVGDEARARAPRQPGSPTPGTPVPSPGTPTPGTQDPGTPAPGAPAPGAPAPGTPQPGTQDPATPRPGTPSPGAPTPGTPGPGTPAPGTPAPGTPAPGTPQPGTQDPATPRPGTPAPSAPTPGTPGTGSPSPGRQDPGTPTPGTPAPGTPAPGAPAPGTPGPDLGGRRDYPETGPYRLTSISPTRVSASGGTTVTVTGAAIPAGATVRVGTSTSALVVGTTTSSRLAFRTPALVPGSYDVYVFGPDRSTHSVLVGGLTYVAEEGTGGAPQPGTPTPGAPQPGAPQPGTPAPGAPQPGTQDPGTPPSGSAPEVTGPNGERLRHSVRFASLGSSIWGVDCSSSCSGLAV